MQARLTRWLICSNEASLTPAAEQFTRFDVNHSHSQLIGQFGSAVDATFVMTATLIK